MLVNPEKESVRCDGCKGQAAFISLAKITQDKLKDKPLNKLLPNKNIDKLLANKQKNGGRLAITDKRKSNAKLSNIASTQQLPPSSSTKARRPRIDLSQKK